MLKIGIATTSAEKTDGIVKAILKSFRLARKEIEAHCAQVESGVPSQPFDEETYQGAENRITEIEKIFPGCDIYISCEAGIESACNMYFNVHVVCIKEVATQSLLWGKSSGWQVPTDDIEIVREIGLDKYLRLKGISAIEELVGRTRSSFVEEATAMALASKKMK